MVFIRYANLRDRTLCSAWANWRLIVQIKVVLESPPRLSLSRWVSLLSLKGTWVSPLLRQVITRPRVVRLKLIFLASSRILPCAPVLPARSVPARSTRLSLADLVEPSWLSWLKWRMRMVWLLELLLFKPVLYIYTFYWPIWINLNISSGQETGTGSALRTRELLIFRFSDEDLLAPSRLFKLSL